MKKFLIIASLCFLLSPLAVFAEDVSLTTDETINIIIDGLPVTYVITSTTGVDSISVDGSSIVLTLTSGDSVTVTNSSGYGITNNVDVATTCSSTNTSSATFTSTVTITANTGIVCSTGSGGGMSPSNTSISINNGASSTSDRAVTISVSANNASEMMLSNKIDFSGATWEAYSKTKSWTLTEGNGEKRVYIKFRSSTGGETSSMSGVIILNGSSSVTPTPTPTPSPSSTTGVPVVIPKETSTSLEGKLVKEPGKSSVYLIENGKLRPYLNGRIFEAHGKKFSDVIEISLQSYSMGNGVDIFPDSYDFTCGQLVKASNAKVYIVSKCETGMSKELIWLKTEEVFLNGGWSFKNINNISDAKKIGFTEMEPFEALYSHPAGSLIKYGDSSKVYLLQKVDGVVKRRWIATEAEFNARKFQFNDVVMIPSKEIYPDGDNMGGTVLGEEYGETFVSDLSLGSNGDEVLALQNVLQSLGHFPGNVVPNGNFGPVTQNSVKAFQKENSLPETGSVGPLTRAILNKF